MTHRVLIADGQVAVRDALARCAEDTLRADVTAVADGGEGLAELEESCYGFDLLLLEVEMPRATGLDVLSAVGSVRPETPVVMFSGEPAHREAALDMGAAAFLQKPFTDDELAELLGALTSRHEVVGV